MNELFRRVRYLLQRRRFDQELANDLDFHREMADRAGSPLSLWQPCSCWPSALA